MAQTKIQSADNKLLTNLYGNDPLCNELPPYSMWNLMHSYIKTEPLKELVGKVEIKNDFSSTKTINGFKSKNYVKDVLNYIDVEKNFYYDKTTLDDEIAMGNVNPDGIVKLTTASGEPYWAVSCLKNVEKRDFKITGGLEPEIDLFLHEGLRYLSSIYPSTYNSEVLLTEEEIFAMFESAYHFLGVYLDNRLLEYYQNTFSFIEKMSLLIRDSLGIIKNSYSIKDLNLAIKKIGFSNTLEDCYKYRNYITNQEFYSRQYIREFLYEPAITYELNFGGVDNNYNITTVFKFLLKLAKETIEGTCRHSLIYYLYYEFFQKYCNLTNANITNDLDNVFMQEVLFLQDTANDKKWSIFNTIIFVFLKQFVGTRINDEYLDQDVIIEALKKITDSNKAIDGYKPVFQITEDDYIKEPTSNSGQLAKDIAEFNASLNSEDSEDLANNISATVSNGHVYVTSIFIEDILSLTSKYEDFINSIKLPKDQVVYIKVVDLSNDTEITNTLKGTRDDGSLVVEPTDEYSKLVYYKVGNHLFKDGDIMTFTKWDTLGTPDVVAKNREEKINEIWKVMKDYDAFLLTEVLDNGKFNSSKTFFSEDIDTFFADLLNGTIHSDVTFDQFDKFDFIPMMKANGDAENILSHENNISAKKYVSDGDTPILVTASKYTSKYCYHISDDLDTDQIYSIKAFKEDFIDKNLRYFRESTRIYIYISPDSYTYYDLNKSSIDVDYKDFIKIYTNKMLSKAENFKLFESYLDAMEAFRESIQQIKEQIQEGSDDYTESYLLNKVVIRVLEDYTIEVVTNDILFFKSNQIVCPIKDYDGNLLAIRIDHIENFSNAHQFKSTDYTVISGNIKNYVGLDLPCCTDSNAAYNDNLSTVTKETIYNMGASEDTTSLSTRLVTLTDEGVNVNVIDGLRVTNQSYIPTHVAHTYVLDLSAYYSTVNQKIEKEYISPSILITKDFEAKDKSTYWDEPYWDNQYWAASEQDKRVYTWVILEDLKVKIVPDDSLDNVRSPKILLTKDLFKMVATSLNMDIFSNDNENPNIPFLSLDSNNNDQIEGDEALYKNLSIKKNITSEVIDPQGPYADLIGKNMSELQLIYEKFAIDIDNDEAQFSSIIEHLVKTQILEDSQELSAEHKKKIIDAPLNFSKFFENYIYDKYLSFSKLDINTSFTNALINAENYSISLNSAFAYANGKYYLILVTPKFMDGKGEEDILIEDEEGNFYVDGQETVDKIWCDGYSYLLISNEDAVFDKIVEYLIQHNIFSYKTKSTLLLDYLVKRVLKITGTTSSIVLNFNGNLIKQQDLSNSLLKENYTNILSLASVEDFYFAKPVQAWQEIMSDGSYKYEFSKDISSKDKIISIRPLYYMHSYDSQLEPQVESFEADVNYRFNILGIREGENEYNVLLECLQGLSNIVDNSTSLVDGTPELKIVKSGIDLLQSYIQDPLRYYYKPNIMLNCKAVNSKLTSSNAIEIENIDLTSYVSIGDEMMASLVAAKNFNESGDEGENLERALADIKLGAMVLTAFGTKMLFYGKNPEKNELLFYYYDDAGPVLLKTWSMDGLNTDTVKNIYFNFTKGDSTRADIAIAYFDRNYNGAGNSETLVMGYENGILLNSTSYGPLDLTMVSNFSKETIAPLSKGKDNMLNGTVGANNYVFMADGKPYGFTKAYELDDNGNYVVDKSAQTLDQYYVNQAEEGEEFEDHNALDWIAKISMDGDPSPMSFSPQVGQVQAYRYYTKAVSNTNGTVTRSGDHLDFLVVAGLDLSSEMFQYAVNQYFNKQIYTEGNPVGWSIVDKGKSTYATVRFLNTDDTNFDATLADLNTELTKHVSNGELESDIFNLFGNFEALNYDYNTGVTAVGGTNAEGVVADGSFDKYIGDSGFGEDFMNRTDDTYITNDESLGDRNPKKLAEKAIAITGESIERNITYFVGFFSNIFQNKKYLTSNRLNYDYSYKYEQRGGGSYVAPDNDGIPTLFNLDSDVNSPTMDQFMQVATGQAHPVVDFSDDKAQAIKLVFNPNETDGKITHDFDEYNINGFAASMIIGRDLRLDIDATLNKFYYVDTSSSRPTIIRSGYLGLEACNEGRNEKQLKAYSQMGPRLLLSIPKDYTIAMNGNADHDKKAEAFNNFHSTVGKSKWLRTQALNGSKFRGLKYEEDPWWGGDRRALYHYDDSTGSKVLEDTPFFKEAVMSTYAPSLGSTGEIVSSVDGDVVYSLSTRSIDLVRRCLISIASVSDTDNGIIVYGTWIDASDNSLKSFVKWISKDGSMPDHLREDIKGQINALFEEDGVIKLEITNGDEAIKYIYNMSLLDTEDGAPEPLGNPEAKSLAKVLLDTQVDASGGPAMQQKTLQGLTVSNMYTTDRGSTIVEFMPAYNGYLDTNANGQVWIAGTGNNPKDFTRRQMMGAVVNSSTGETEYKVLTDAYGNIKREGSKFDDKAIRTMSDASFPDYAFDEVHFKSFIDFIVLPKIGLVDIDHDKPMMLASYIGSMSTVIDEMIGGEKRYYERNPQGYNYRSINGNQQNIKFGIPAGRIKSLIESALAKHEDLVGDKMVSLNTPENYAKCLDFFVEETKDMYVIKDDNNEYYNYLYMCVRSDKTSDELNEENFLYCVMNNDKTTFKALNSAIALLTTPKDQLTSEAFEGIRTQLTLFEEAGSSTTISTIENFISQERSMEARMKAYMPLAMQEKVMSLNDPVYDQGFSYDATKHLFDYIEYKLLQDFNPTFKLDDYQRVISGFMYTRTDMYKINISKLKCETNNYSSALIPNWKTIDEVGVNGNVIDTVGTKMRFPINGYGSYNYQESEEAYLSEFTPEIERAVFDSSDTMKNSLGKDFTFDGTSKVVSKMVYPNFRYLVDAVDEVVGDLREDVDNTLKLLDSSLMTFNRPINTELKDHHDFEIVFATNDVEDTEIRIVKDLDNLIDYAKVGPILKIGDNSYEELTSSFTEGIFDCQPYYAIKNGREEFEATKLCKFFSLGLEREGLKIKDKIVDGKVVFTTFDSISEKTYANPKWQEGVEAEALVLEKSLEDLEKYYGFDLIETSFINGMDGTYLSCTDFSIQVSKTYALNENSFNTWAYSDISIPIDSFIVHDSNYKVNGALKFKKLSDYIKNKNIYFKIDA